MFCLGALQSVDFNRMEPQAVDVLLEVGEVPQKIGRFGDGDHAILNVDLIDFLFCCLGCSRR